MGAYLARIDATPANARWALVRNWIFTEPLPFFAEMRAERPVLVLPELTIAFRHADCMAILRRHHSFGVDLYKPKQGDYFMAQDDTAVHWREKSIMKTVLDREDIPAIRQWVGTTTAAALKAGKGDIEAVRTITRGVPVALVQHWFGFADADPDKLIDWAYWNQQDAFWNQPFDVPFIKNSQAIIDNRQKASVMLGLYLARLIAKRTIAVKLGSDANDPVTRLLKLAFSDALKFNVKNVLFNVGGLLIGATETTSHCVTNALEYLLAHPDLFASARIAASLPDHSLFDGYVYEALRFRPAFPYYFRTCHVPTTFAAETPHATTVQPGTTVLAMTHSAMFDVAGFPDPDGFVPQRDQSDSFTYGQGIHACLGVAIASVMVPEIVRQLVLRPNLAAPAPPDYRGGRVPESWRLRYKP
jgi:cytochrome P450